MGIARDARFAWGLVRRRPFDCTIQVTNRCNMTCGFCGFPAHAAPPRDELSLGEFRRIEAGLSGMGCFIVSIEGGEPFLRPDLPEIVRIFGARHIPVLFTSGWHVRSDNAAELFSAGLVHAAVSIDYPDAARHDGERGIPGAFDGAWRAVEFFREAAPRGGRQVEVMTVLMEDNWRDLEALLDRSGARGVGHWVTLLSTRGDRRGRGRNALPPPEAADHLLDLWRRHPHFRTFRDFLAGLKPFLGGGPLPTCRAGIQSFNIDHLGNVAPCIEKMDRVAGNIRRESLAAVHARLAADRSEVSACRDCWTVCRGALQCLGRGGSRRSLADLASRMRV